MFRKIRFQMIANSTHHAVLEGLLPQPTVEGNGLLWKVSGIHKIAGVNQDISLRQFLNGAVEAMGVRKNHETHLSILQTSEARPWPRSQGAYYSPKGAPGPSHLGTGDDRDPTGSAVNVNCRYQPKPFREHAATDLSSTRLKDAKHKE
jgi:hypothetical protein